MNQYMHLHYDTEISNMCTCELKRTLKERNIEFHDFQSDNDLREALPQAEWTRTLGIWHDHSTLLGFGYILVTVKVMYNTAKPSNTWSQIQVEDTYSLLWKSLRSTS